MRKCILLTITTLALLPIHAFSGNHAGVATISYKEPQLAQKPQNKLVQVIDVNFETGEIVYETFFEGPQGVVELDSTKTYRLGNDSKISRENPQISPDTGKAILRSLEEGGTLVPVHPYSSSDNSEAQRSF